VPVPAWSSLDPNDRELLELMPFLEAIARQGPPDVRVVVDNYL
jgi:TFIIF-interacting CTD phosphatase-like protein